MDYETVLWGISWVNINMMMADFPQWEYDRDAKKEDEEDEIVEDVTQLIGRF